MSNTKMKLRLIEEIIEIDNERLLNGLCEVLIERNYNYIDDLFESSKDFEEFIRDNAEYYEDDK